MDNGAIVSCGDSVPIIIERSIGLSKKDSVVLKGIAEGKLGFMDILDFKVAVEKSLGSEVSWQTSDKTTKTYIAKAPKCGRCEATIYRLVRRYDMNIFRKKYFFSINTPHCNMMH